MSGTNESPSPFRTRGFVASAVVVGLLAVLGGGVAVSNVLGRPNPTTPPATVAVSTPPGATTATTAAPEPSICGLTAYAATGTLTKAPQATWTLVGTTAAPKNAAGPGLIEDDGYRHCYAHTPEGAVLASANFVAMGSVRTIQQKVAQSSIVPGPGRDKLLAEPIPSTSGGGVRIQVTGFRVLNYTGTTATVDVAMRTSNGALAGQVFDLQWDGGDWKVRLTANGDMLSQLVQLRDLGGYIPWAGA